MIIKSHYTHTNKRLHGVPPRVFTGVDAPMHYMTEGIHNRTRFAKADIHSIHLIGCSANGNNPKFQPHIILGVESCSANFPMVFAVPVSNYKVRQRSEDNIKHALQDVRVSLIEADVEIDVMRTFINTVKERCLGDVVTLKQRETRANAGDGIRSLHQYLSRRVDQPNGRSTPVST